MDQLYYEVMAICGSVRFPNMFLTFTCNPNWPEIQRLLKPIHLKPQDHPGIVSRIFKIKFNQLIKDLKNNQIFGKIGAPFSLFFL